MVCVPCLVIPFVLWVFHKYIRPVLIKIWNPFGILGKEDAQTDKSAQEEKQKLHTEQNGLSKPHDNGLQNGVANGGVKVGGSSKKDD